MKRIITLILSVMMLFSMVVIPVSSEAAGKETYYDSIASLTPSALDTIIRAGVGSQYSENTVQKNNKWYFKFSAGGSTVCVLCDAFRMAAKGTSSNLKSVNSAIGKAVASRQNSKQEIFLFSSVKQKKSDAYGERYSWNITKIEISGIYDTAGITYKIRKVAELKVDYISQWRARSTTLKFKHGALKKGNQTYEFTPRIDTAFTKVGKNGNYFSSAYVKGKGKVPKEVKIPSLIDIGITVSNLVAGATCPAARISSLLELLKYGDTLKKANTISYSGDKYILSNNKQKAVKGSFTSPSKICDVGDFFQVTLGLNTEISKSKPLPVITFSFSVK